MEEIVNEWDEKIQGDKIEDQITEEMFYLVSREALKDCGCTLDSMLTECRHARAERNCSEEHTLEGTTREEIFSSFFTEIFVMVVMEAMTETHTISGETKARDRFRILEDFTSSDKLHTSLDIGKEEHLFQKQDSQPEHVKFENLKRRAIPAMKEHKTPPHIEALKHEELNKFQHTRELLTEIDSTSHSVNSKKAMEQVAVSKGLLRELRSSLGVAVEDTEMFDEEVKVNLSTSDFTPILEFSQVLMEFKRKVEKKLVLNIVRYLNF